MVALKKKTTKAKSNGTTSKTAVKKSAVKKVAVKRAAIKKAVIKKAAKRSPAQALKLAEKGLVAGSRAVDRATKLLAAATKAEGVLRARVEKARARLSKSLAPAKPRTLRDIAALNPAA